MTSCHFESANFQSDCFIAQVLRQNETADKVCSWHYAYSGDKNNCSFLGCLS